MSLLPNFSEVLIIGGGAAGLFCAITAAKRGRKVLLLEHNNRVGKKILMSGGGRCNFTNLDVQPENYLGGNPHFCKSALSRYTQWDFIDLVESHSVLYHEKKLGQLFCDNKSQDILDMLLAEFKDAGAELVTQCVVDEICQTGSGFEVVTQLGKLKCEKLVIATGGLSIPTMGATAFGYEIAKQFGHEIISPVAALVPFTFSDHHKEKFSALSGISTDAIVEAECGNAFREQILFTHRGLSGPAILQISSYWKQGEVITLNLLPEFHDAQWIFQAKKEHPNKQLKTLLSQELPAKLVVALESLMVLKEINVPLQQISADRLEQIYLQLSRWKLKPAGTEGYRTAEVTLGGVDTNAVSSKTMESKLCPGLYFIGEVLDVSGQLGGFNFQWAWASGFVAGECV